MFFYSFQVRVSLDDVLTFADGLTGKTFIVRKRGYSGFVGSENWYTHINRIRDETVDFLWKELVHKTNQFFTDAICLKSTGCKCPNPITKSEIRFSYPKGCFGHWKCLHPCGRFGYSYDWCCENGELDYNYDCRPPNWDSCMKVNTPTVNPPNVLKKPPKGTSKKSE